MEAIIGSQGTFVLTMTIVRADGTIEVHEVPAQQVVPSDGPSRPVQ